MLFWVVLGSAGLLFSFFLREARGTRRGARKRLTISDYFELFWGLLGSPAPPGFYERLYSLPKSEKKRLHDAPQACFKKLGVLR